MSTKLNATIRIPTGTAYAYLEVQVKGTPDEIVRHYYLLSEAYWKEQRRRTKKTQEK